MKWGVYPARKGLSSKWVSYLLLVLGVALLSSAGQKWG